MTLATTTTVHKDDLTVIPAADLNSWRTDLPQGLDGAAGGDYVPGGKINVQGSGFGTIEVHTLSEVLVGGQRVFPLGAIVADTDGQLLTLAGGQIREFDEPTAQRDHEISTVGATLGSWIQFTRPVLGNFAIILHRVGEAAAIVTLPNLTWSSATVYYDSAGDWRLLDTSGGNPGLDA